MENGTITNSRTRGVAWIAGTLFVGGLALPFAVFGTLVSLGHNPQTSAAIISMTVAVGFAGLLAFVLALIAWRHPIGKVTTIGTVVLAIAATVLLLRSGPELDGTWKGVLMENADGSSVNLKSEIYRLNIKGDKFHLINSLIVTDQDRLPSEYKGFFTYDTTARPRTFGAGGNGTNVKSVYVDWHGTYELDGDTLTLHWTRGGKLVLSRVNN